MGEHHGSRLPERCLALPKVSAPGRGNFVGLEFRNTDYELY
jgi:hypothetical protein